MWHLALKDIHTLTHVYPEVLPAMVEAFTDRWEIRLQAMSPDSRYSTACMLMWQLLLMLIFR